MLTRFFRMDPLESVVSLEDDQPEIMASHFDQTLDARPTDGFENTNLASDQSSGVCSPPGDASLASGSHARGDQRAAPDQSGDQLIRDVIHQLEKQCSTSNDDTLKSSSGEIAVDIGEDATLPLASTLSATLAFDKGVSPSLDAHTTPGGYSGAAYSIWIASAKTRETLALLPSSSDGRICYTMPGVMIEDSLGDPTTEALRKFCGDDPTLPVGRINRSTAAQINIPTLLDLVATGNFRAAIDLTGKLLKVIGQGAGKAHQPSRNTEESLKIWSLRLHLLVCIGQYNLASSEMEAFGNLDGPDLYYEYHQESYHDRKGSMVPFSMRLLHAELPYLVGQHQESLVRLNRMVAVVKQLIRNIDSESTLAPHDRAAALTLWRRRQRKVQFAFARCQLAVKDFRLASATYEELRNDEIANCSVSGRVQLMLGNLDEAAKEFQRYQAAGEDSKTKAWMSVHNGYLNLFNNSFSDALVDFQKAIRYDPSNIYAINNAAVCLLYLGRLEEAVAMQETAVQANPAAALQEGICTNLCTLYELESARSTQKKISVLKMINTHRGDGFNVSCLKLPV